MLRDCERGCKTSQKPCPSCGAAGNYAHHGHYHRHFAPRSARWSPRTSTSTARAWTACRARGRGQGASAMARIVSRKHSHREIPRMTRSRSLTPTRAKQREARMIKALWPKGTGEMVESTGSGYLPPHQASVASMSAEVRHAAGIDSGMIPIQG